MGVNIVPINPVKAMAVLMHNQIKPRDVSFLGGVVPFVISPRRAEKIAQVKIGIPPMQAMLWL